MTLSLIKNPVELLVKKMEQSFLLARERITYTKLIYQILNLRMLNAFFLLAVSNRYGTKDWDMSALEKSLN